ncbi:hypothetical protein GCM10023223_17120 [Stackebrandtia albiflava]
MALGTGRAGGGYGGAVTDYGSARVRTAAKPSGQVYARRRLIAGLVAGALGQLLVATLLGFLLAGGLAYGVRVMATLFSGMIATPLLFTAGFALMFKNDSRSLGGGVVLGAFLASLLLVVLYLLL